jgi:protein O-GlcNAc transferase
MSNQNTSNTPNTNLDIYQQVVDSVPPNEIQKQLNTKFEAIMKNMKRFVVCNELNIYTNSMTYVFEHIKDALVEVVTVFIPPERRNYISQKLWADLQWRKEFLDTLVKLNYPSIILWFFLYTNYYNVEDLDNQRKQLLENMELISRYYPKSMYFKTVDELYWACPVTNLLFSLSYQNHNNKHIMERYTQLMRQVCPDLTYDIIGTKKATKKSKIRVLFISEFLAYDSSVLRDRMGIIVKLPRSKFEVFYAAYEPLEAIKGNVSKHFNQLMKNNYIQLTSEISKNRDLITRHNFDVIVYCELGMSMLSYWLSFSRLAPVQVTTWGHSETSGVSTIDYFVSSKYFEHEKAQNHYSEKLYLMDSLSTYYFPPSQILVNNYTYKTRKDMQLDDNIHLYGCIQSSFKISKNFETILSHILDRDPSGYILMSTYKPFCKSQMERMYAMFGDEKFRRLIFYPGIEINQYLNLVKLMDVMLDPYPFGGCNTSFEAFDYNLPVVTFPTRFINGRFTFGMYKCMGFIDMIATTAENYVKIAVKCATDKNWRNEIVEKIKDNKHKLFMDEQSITDWANFLEEKTNEYYNGTT